MAGKVRTKLQLVTQRKRFMTSSQVSSGTGKLLPGDDIHVRGENTEEYYAKVAQSPQGRNAVSVWWYYCPSSDLPGCNNELYLSDHKALINIRDVIGHAKILNSPHDKELYSSKMYRVDRKSLTVVCV